jgi:Rieske Fe-S protein
MDPGITIHPVIARRTALAAGLGGAAALALAACGGSGGSETAPQAGSGADRTPGNASGSDGIATLDSIAVGSSVGAELHGNPVLVSRPSADSAACFSAICTHQGCIVEAAGKQFRCPCHGSVYNATTGAVIEGPAPRSLAKIPVRIRKGEIVPA